MDEMTTPQKAALVAAVACRLIDYYIAAQKISNGITPKTSADALDEFEDARNHAERRVAVSIENAIDAGALE